MRKIDRKRIVGSRKNVERIQLKINVPENRATTRIKSITPL